MPTAALKVLHPPGVFSTTSFQTWAEPPALPGATQGAPQYLGSHGFPPSPIFRSGPQPDGSFQRS